MRTTFIKTYTALLVGLVPVLTSAQNGPLEEIVVTATKREQTLQDIPVAVTVTTGEAIEKAQIQDIKDLQSLVPSLRVSQLQNSSNTNFIIRGFGNGANNAGIEPSVGVFIDGVYRSRSAAQISDLPNVQRVEVLSGPQNTLFGKNASAGVISVITREPTGEAAGKFSVTAGNYSQMVVKGQLEGAVSDTVAFDISGGYNDRDGYYDNLVTGNEINDRNRYDLRGQLVYRPNDESKVRIIADYSEIDETCCGTNNLLNGPTGAAVMAVGGQFVPNDAEALAGFYNFDPNEKIENSGLSAQFDRDFGNFTLTSITAYRNVDRSSDIDADFTSANLLTNDIQAEFDTFTQEIRLTSSGEGSVDWMIGGFYFDESIEGRNNLNQGITTRAFFDVLTAAQGAPGALATVEAFTGNPVGSTFFFESITDFRTLDNESLSLFGTVDWHINERLTATLGLNYTEDEKDATLREPASSTFSSINLNELAGGAFRGLEQLQFTFPVVDIPNSIESGRSDDSDLTYTLRLAYNWTDAINVYANISTGYKASSWNLSRDSRPFTQDIIALQAAGLAPSNQRAGTRFADPEEAQLYELGFKARFERVSLNVAIFQQEIENFQSNLFVGGGFNLANADKQSTKGIEFDLKYYPVDALRLGLSATLLDPEYDSFPNASVPDNGTNNGVGDLSGQTPAGIHEVSLSLSAGYDFEIGGLPAYVSGDFQYDDQIQLNDNVPEAVASREVKNLNLSAGINTETGWGFSIWGRNVTDHETLISSFPSVAQPGSFSGYRSQPRTYGVSISKEF